MAPNVRGRRLRSAWTTRWTCLALGPCWTGLRLAFPGGERQRVALGRALLTQPKLLLMDEPLSSLDAGAKAEILPYLERLHRGLAIPALYVSHDAGEIARLADRVIYMAGGAIVARATANEPTLAAAWTARRATGWRSRRCAPDPT